jgi:hypothetical protein
MGTLMSSLKNCWVGNLQVATHTLAHAASSRYLDLDYCIDVHKHAI